MLLNKKSYEISDSPPPTAQCKCSVKRDGKLTVGWRGDIKNAWHIVLGVLGIGEDGRPLSVDQMATAARNDCDARATAARN